MPDAQHLLLFILAGWLLNLTPGPDVLYIVSNSLRQGVRAGVVAGLGVTAGCFVHVFAAAVGVGALLSTSALAFTLLKWAGAAYLVWLGLKLLWTKAPSIGEELVPQAVMPSSTRQVFMGGFWTNVLNPKVAIFFLAFVPQFIAPESPHKTLAFLTLGVLFNLNSIPVNSGWALAAGWFARQATVRRSLHWLDRLAGVMFLGFGLRLALTDNPAR